MMILWRLSPISGHCLQAVGDSGCIFIIVLIRMRQALSGAPYAYAERFCTSSSVLFAQSQRRRSRGSFPLHMIRNSLWVKHAHGSTKRLRMRYRDISHGPGRRTARIEISGKFFIRLFSTNKARKYAPYSMMLFNERSGK